MEKHALFLLLLPALCLAYHDTCIPECVPGATPPNQGGPMCRCTPEATLFGCQVYACKPGQDSSGAFTCMCTPENHQAFCVKPRCNNSTLSAFSSGEEAGADTTTCNKLCNCRQQPPECDRNSGDPQFGAPDCTCSKTAWPTGCTLRPCTAADQNIEFGSFFCECTKDYKPDFCYTPMCSSLLDQINH